jgi:hypothetical protein
MLKGRKKKNVMGGKSQLAPESHYATMRPASPTSSSPPPLLLPPDLSLGSKPFNLRTNTASKRESNNKESSESPKSYFGRRQSDETAKVKKGNDWY